MPIKIIRSKRTPYPKQYSNWRRHIDEVFVKTGGETHYLWRAVDHEGEVLEVSRRLGISSKSLYDWKKQYHKPEPERANEAVQAAEYGV